MADLITGPSAGITGGESQNAWPQAFLDGHPGFAKAVIQSGRRPRVGHDRKRWESVRWEDYRAHVGICGRKGPWRVEMAEEKPATPSQWVAEGDGLPFVPGWYTALIHDTRGLVMSDVPAEIAGCLPLWRDRRRRDRAPRTYGAKSRALLAALVRKAREATRPRPVLRPVPGGAR